MFAEQTTILNHFLLQIQSEINPNNVPFLQPSLDQSEWAMGWSRMTAIYSMFSSWKKRKKKGARTKEGVLVTVMM